MGTSQTAGVEVRAMIRSANVVRTRSGRLQGNLNESSGCTRRVSGCRTIGSIVVRCSLLFRGRSPGVCGPAQRSSSSGGTVYSGVRCGRSDRRKSRHPHYQASARRQNVGRFVQGARRVGVCSIAKCGRTEMSDFVKVVDLNHRVQVINTRQIVRVAQNHPPNWDVLLTSGEPVSLSTAEAEKLFKTVPVAHHAKEADPKSTH